MSQLDPVQLEALKFAAGKPGVLFHMDMGLGKSLVALKEFQELCDARQVDRAIIVCPNTFKLGWVDEIEKHGFDLLFNVHVFASDARRKTADFLNRKDYSRPPILIINYEAMRRPISTRALVRWAERGKCYLVIDESIQIKGSKSDQTKAAHKLASWSPWTTEPDVCRVIRLLTGRAQAQGPHDLWGQLRAIGLCRQYTPTLFKARYCVMGGHQKAVVVDTQNTIELARAMKPYVFRALKKDWAPELPRKDQVVLDYEMSGEQLVQYRMMEKQFLVEIEEGVVKVEVAIAKYAKLAQIQCGFVYDDDKVVHELVEPEDNPRLQLLLKTIEEIPGKVAVVYRHKAMLRFLIKALFKWQPAWIKGQMDPDDIQEHKAMFNGDPKCRVILLQCDASKYGHTLLGSSKYDDDRCSTMIFFENSYNADTRAQIEDRIHRRGQTAERVLYIDFSGSPLDRKITKALQRKDEMFHKVFMHLGAKNGQTSNPN